MNLAIEISSSQAYLAKNGVLDPTFSQLNSENSFAGSRNSLQGFMVELMFGLALVPFHGFGKSCVQIY